MSKALGIDPATGNMTGSRPQVLKFAKTSSGSPNRW